MSIIKNVSGPYTINTINHNDPIILDSNVVIIKGNLQIVGNSTVVNTSNTTIKDNFITLNDGELSSGVSAGFAGIQVDRGLDIDVDIRWNESSNNWQITNDGTTYYNVVATTTGNTRLVDDFLPTLSANLDVNAYAITNNLSATIIFDPIDAVNIFGNVTILKIPTGAIANTYPDSVTVSASNVGTGGSGIFVTNDEGITNQELITKAKAVVYSIIF